MTANVALELAAEPTLFFATDSRCRCQSGGRSYGERCVCRARNYRPVFVPLVTEWSRAGGGNRQLYGGAGEYRLADWVERDDRYARGNCKASGT